MTELEFSIFDPNTLLYHRAGIAGLALALSGIDPKDAPLKWEVTEDTIKLSWQGNDSEVVQWLLQHTYRIEKGYLEAPALKLDEQGCYIFSEGVMSTFLQHNKQRDREKQTVCKAFSIEHDKLEIPVEYKPVTSCYYTRDFKKRPNKVFTSKGVLKKEVPIKGHHLPGLVECFVNGAYVESSTGFLALLFLPLACGYYQLPKFRSALVIPEVRDLKAWVKRRQQLPARTYASFRSSSPGASGLHFLLQDRLIEHSKLLRVDCCEVYQLGKQPWDGNQSYLKQAVYRFQIKDLGDQVLDQWETAFRNLQPKVIEPKEGKEPKKGKPYLKESLVLGWISDNLVANKVWYSGFFEFQKAESIYPDDRKGLIIMTEEHLTPAKRVLFDAVQGSFRTYLRNQGQEAARQGRSLDYPRAEGKVIHRLQRPGTEQQFRAALVKFLSDFGSKAAKGNGLEISDWLSTQRWREARDLALLAVATYKGKSEEEGEAIQADQSSSEEANVI